VLDRIACLGIKFHIVRPATETVKTKTKRNDYTMPTHGMHHDSRTDDDEYHKLSKVKEEDSQGSFKPGRFAD